MFSIWFILFLLSLWWWQICSWSIILDLTGSWMKRGRSCSSCRVYCKQWRSWEKLDSLYLILCYSSWVAQIKAPVLLILTGNTSQYLWKLTLAWSTFYGGYGKFRVTKGVLRVLPCRRYSKVSISCDSTSENYVFSITMFNGTISI